MQRLFYGALNITTHSVFLGEYYEKIEWGGASALAGDLMRL
jgi:hypothetical protein